MSPPRPPDAAAAAPPHLHVAADTDLASLRRQLRTAEPAAVRAVSVSAEPDAGASLSWTLQRLSGLQELRLLRSPLAAGLRAFGSGLLQLRVLWLVGCELATLDGVSALPLLAELYAAQNRLQDVSVCSCLEYLQILDVEENRVTDLSSFMFLRTCSELRSLEMRGNPVCADPAQLAELPAWLPQLLTLNGALTAAGRRLQRPPEQLLPPLAAGTDAKLAAARVDLGAGHGRTPQVSVPPPRMKSSGTARATVSTLSEADKTRPAKLTPARRSDGESERLPSALFDRRSLDSYTLLGDRSGTDLMAGSVVRPCSGHSASSALHLTDGRINSAGESDQSRTSSRQSGTSSRQSGVLSRHSSASSRQQSGTSSRHSSASSRQSAYSDLSPSVGH